MRFAIFALILMTTPAMAETITRTEAGTAVEIRLSDDLAAFPAFAAFLRSDAEAVVGDFVAEGAGRVGVRDRAVRRNARFASVLREVVADIGGAAPYRRIEAMTWDRAAQDFVRLDAFFDRGEARDEALIAISHHLREAISARVWAGAVDAAYKPLVLQATNPDPAVLSNFVLSDEGLAFYYSPREIAPLAKGAPAISAPLALFRAWLNPTGLAAFR